MDGDYDENKSLAAAVAGSWVPLLDDVCYFKFEHIFYRIADIEI